MEEFPCLFKMQVSDLSSFFFLLAPRLLWEPCGYRRAEAVTAWLLQGSGQGRDECSAEEKKHGLLCNVTSIIGRDLRHVIN